MPSSFLVDIIKLYIRLFGLILMCSIWINYLNFFSSQSTVSSFSDLDLKFGSMSSIISSFCTYHHFFYFKCGVTIWGDSLLCLACNDLKILLLLKMHSTEFSRYCFLVASPSKPGSFALCAEIVILSILRTCVWMKLEQHDHSIRANMCISVHLSENFAEV